MDRNKIGCQPNMEERCTFHRDAVEGVGAARVCVLKSPVCQPLTACIPEQFQHPLRACDLLLQGGHLYSIVQDRLRCDIMPGNCVKDMAHNCLHALLRRSSILGWAILTNTCQYKCGYSYWCTVCLVTRAAFIHQDLQKNRQYIETRYNNATCESCKIWESQTPSRPPWN